MSQNEGRWSVNWVSTIFDLASWIIQLQWNPDNPQWTYRQRLLADMLVRILRPPCTIERKQRSTVFVEAQNATQQSTALCCSLIEFYVVSVCNLIFYTTSQICLHCPTDLMFWLQGVQSIFKNPQSRLLYHYFGQSFELDYPAFWFIMPCQIENLLTPRWSRVWSLTKMDLSLFVIWATLLYKSSSIRGGLQ